jgi:hypothetical protein
MKIYRNLLVAFTAFTLTAIEASQSRTIGSTQYVNFLYSFLKNEETVQSNSWLLNQPNKLTGKQKILSTNCQSIHTEPNFLVVGGGGAPSYNEIALEKNVLYFQRTLKEMGYDPFSATIFFANGNDKKATVRYLDSLGNEKFKLPQIPDTKGAATVDGVQNYLENMPTKSKKKPLFFYFTGHGHLNRENPDNNALILWQEKLLTVGQLSSLLDKLPQDRQIVTMMAQCYSGSFANFIYQDGMPSKPVALQTRCGFFATISTRPSVGCTPEVNEADYQDYSSSFFAGLSGVNRLGKVVASADYNRDGRVSYAEAHAFAKVDERATDLPVSTSEVWLQRKMSESDIDDILSEPLVNLINAARPEQKYVVTSLARRFNFSLKDSYWNNFHKLLSGKPQTEVQETYQVRLAMELINIGMEQKIYSGKNRNELDILNRLIDCEASSWK